MTHATRQTAPSPAHWDDALLLDRMLNKNGAAWREFHRRYDRLVHRCIQKVTSRFPGSLGSEDAREIFAHFLLSITARDMHKLRAFEPERGNKLSSWIGLLATNCAWDYLRRIARRPQSCALTDAESVGDTSDDPFSDLLKKERWNRVNETLRSFSAKDRRFVKLYYVEGLSPEDVADQMEISVKTVYSKKHKIRCRLEAALRLDGGPDAGEPELGSMAQAA